MFSFDYIAFKTLLAVALVLLLATVNSSKSILYGRKFWRGIYFGGLAVFRAIRQYFIRQINFKV